MIMGAWGLGRKRLPYDAEVEYLESTGTQWIDTGLYGSQIQYGGVEIDCTVLGFVNGVPVLAGILPINNFCFVGMAYNSGSTLFNDLAGIRTITTYSRLGFSNSFYGGRMKLKALGGTLRAENVSSGNSYTWSYSKGLCNTDGLTNKLALFGYANATRAGYGCIYSFRVWDGNQNLIGDYLPVRFTNEQGVSEGAMYDRANPTVGMNPDGSPRTDGLYRNRGTGAFLWAEKQ